jgi:hypothetical protein
MAIIASLLKSENEVEKYQGRETEDRRKIHVHV